MPCQISNLPSMEKISGLWDVLGKGVIPGIEIWVIIFAMHSGRYGHNNETLILQSFAFIMQFYTYSNPYDIN